MKKLVGSLTALCLCAVFSGYAVTYYIGPAGSDANDGLSPATAFGTFLTATETVNDGDTLVILTGVYTNPVNRVGTNPQVYFGQKTNNTFLSGVTYRGEGPDKTIFWMDSNTVPSNVWNSRFIRFLGTNNKLESFALKGELAGDDWWGPIVYVINSFSGCVISNIYIKFPDSQVNRTGISPVWNNSVTNLLVTHCLVDGGGIGVRDFNNACFHYTTFRNCTLVNQRDIGNAARGAGVIVEGNDGTIIKNSIMMNQTRYGIQLWNPLAGVATTTVENCIWYGATNGFIYLTSAATVANESGTLNVDPNLQTDALGLPYCSPLTYASYGWRAVPEPTVTLVLGLLALAGLRRK